MDKKKDGTQNEPRSSRGSEDHNRLQPDPHEHTSGKGGSSKGENKSIRGGGETDSREFSVDSLRETFFSFTGKILRGLLAKSENDKRIWEDRLQESRDCIVWYQNLLERCEKEISLAQEQIIQVENMLSQLNTEE